MENKEALEPDLGSGGLDVGLHLLPELGVGEGPVPAAPAADDGVVAREREVAQRQPLVAPAGRHTVPHAPERVAAHRPRHVAQVHQQRAGAGAGAGAGLIIDVVLDLLLVIEIVLGLL